MATSAAVILVVEDRPVMQKIIRRLLVQLGYENIETAINGREALERIRNHPFDLILSDWNMDEMSGFELLKAVRVEPGREHTPLILITAEAKEANIEVAKAAGVNDYLIKPFTLDAFQSAVEKIMGPSPVALTAA